MAYRYKVRGTGKIIRPGRAPAPEKEVEIIGLINGIPPGSKEEWRVYKALEKLKIPYFYQVPMGGGRNLRGGVVLDFLVFNPTPIPLPIHGGYWHTRDERLEDAVIANYLNVSIEYVQDHVIWDWEIPTQEDAYKIVKERAR